jgi:hypothetical protein
MVSATDETCGWLAHAVARRNTRADKPALVLMDGPTSRWEAGQREVPQGNTVAMRDLWHVPPWLWDAAPLFESRDADHALRVVDDRVLRIGQSDGCSVVSGPLQMGAKRPLRGTNRDTLATISGSVPTNAHRMCDEAYLIAGSPIASGVH